MAIIPLSNIQKERLKRLNTSLIKACKAGDLKGARTNLYDIKPILLLTGNTARYYIAYLRYLEACMDFDNINNALSAIKSIKEKSNKNTRVYLEASSLLAICYIRLGNFNEAEPIIKDVLKNDKVIKSESRRFEFRKEAISRFDEEALIYGLSEKNPPTLQIKEIEEIIHNNIYKSDIDIHENIGMVVPNSAKHLLSRIDSFSKKQLPTAERLALPSGQEIVENKKVGKRIQKFVSRVLYNSFCDKESETYKSIISGKLNSFNSLITITVVETFQKFSIGLKLLIGLVATAILKAGIDFICSISRPKSLIDYR